METLFYDTMLALRAGLRSATSLLRHCQGRLRDYARHLGSRARRRWPISGGRFGCIGTGLLGTVLLLTGCGQMPLLDPKGPVGHSQRLLIFTTIGLMLIVIIPVFIMAFWFSRKYRASNTKATYAPKWDYSTSIDLAIWLVPIAIVIVLAYFLWTYTYRLDPYKPIASQHAPLSIEVVSLDWKWLFIYPDQGIAVVNQLVFPASVPLSFKLTSDSVMTSFFIPQLGSQMYAMAGMQTRLHLMADEPGVFSGQNQEFSGRGYSDMHFKAIATTPEEFKNWVEKVRRSPDVLDADRFDRLRKPATGTPITFFSSVEPGLFKRIVSQYMGWMGQRGDAGMPSTMGTAPVPMPKAVDADRLSLENRKES